MYIDDLTLETTRKCNLNCRHCLRGSTQRVTMTHEILIAAMRDVEYVGHVLFTGGEPSLAPEVLEWFAEEVTWRKISFGGFYVITNGKSHNGLKRFMKACDRLYYLADEQSACGVTVSQDQYHKELRVVDWQRYEMRDEYGRHYGEYPPYFAEKGRDHTIDHPFDEGRAFKNGIGYDSPHAPMPWDIDYNDDGSLHVKDDNGMVYIAANGNVVSGCNMSFRRLDKEAKGNVLTTPLPQIIESFCTPEERLVANG